ncbi:MAG: hypothetical protein NVS1B4_07520 [Gemmatimonadaceae bacterium]
MRSTEAALVAAALGFGAAIGACRARAKASPTLPPTVVVQPAEDLLPPGGPCPPPGAARDDSSGLLYYFGHQVRPAARRLAGNAPVRPLAQDGRVLARFLVDTAGRPVLTSLRFVESNGSVFEAEARDYIASSRYTVALRGGCPVAQLVQQSFAWRLP